MVEKEKVCRFGKNRRRIKINPTGNVDETSDEPLLVRLSKSSLSEKEIDQDALNLLKGRQLLSVKEEVERTFSLTDEGNNFSLESLDENLIGDISDLSNRVSGKMIIPKYSVEGGVKLVIFPHFTH